MQNTESSFGPRKFEGVTVFYRLLAGIVGGIAGGLIILIGVILANSLFQALADPTAAVSPFAIFMGISVLFIAGLIGNGMSVFLMSLCDQDKYQNPYSGLLQVAMINIFIFVLCIPAYFLARTIDINYMMLVALVQIVTSALASMLAFNAVTVRANEFVIDIYGGFISILFGLGIAAIVALMSSTPAPLFFGLPIIIWFSIGFFGGLTEFFYYQLYRHTGVDLLETSEDDYTDEEFDKK
ncbi:MAG: hypothetical protein HY817_01095 [Candidatus Abawacabacteria bacterium]|nr:hypothetical protein [Candidatus Abawacabacteria bacterium]